MENGESSTGLIVNFWSTSIHVSTEQKKKNKRYLSTRFCFNYLQFSMRKYSLQIELRFFMRLRKILQRKIILSNTFHIHNDERVVLVFPHPDFSFAFFFFFFRPFPCLTSTYKIVSICNGHPRFYMTSPRGPRGNESLEISICGANRSMERLEWGPKV